MSTTLEPAALTVFVAGPSFAAVWCHGCGVFAAFVSVPVYADDPDGPLHAKWCRLCIANLTHATEAA